VARCFGHEPQHPLLAVKSIRRLAVVGFWSAAAIAVVALALFVPAVQTWIGQGILNAYSPIPCSVGSLSLSFTDLEVDDLRLELDGATWTAPSLKADIPLLAWLHPRQLRIHRLVAQGWTLDLRHPDAAATAPEAPPGNAGASPDASSRPPATSSSRRSPGMLDRWRLPNFASLDGLDLAGQILAPSGAAGGEPVKIQVHLHGGGLTDGQAGRFALDASATGPGLPADILTAQGQLTATRLPGGAWQQLALTADFAARGGSLPGELRESADLTAVREGDTERYGLELRNGARAFLRLDARRGEAPAAVDGTWRADLRGADVVPLFPDLKAPDWSARGSGRFAADGTRRQLRVLGHLDGTLGPSDALWPALRFLGGVRMGGDFDFTQEGHSLRLDTAAITASGAAASATLVTVQGGTIDERTAAFAPAHPGSDWAELEVRGSPWAALAGRTGDWTLSGGSAAGRFRVRALPAGWALRSIGPVTASAVTVRWSDRTLGAGLDLAAVLTAEASPSGWKVHTDALTADRAGHRLGSLAGTLSPPPDADTPGALTGTWTVDLAALAAAPPWRGKPWIKGRSAAGNYSLQLGATVTGDVTLTVAGHAPADTLTASVHAQIDPDRTVTLRAPVRLAWGGDATDLSIDARWTDDAADGELQLSATGADVSVDQLRRLAAPWASQGDAGVGGATGRFWGDWVGTATVAFARVRAHGEVYTGVGGSFTFDHRSLRLKEGRGERPPHRLSKWEGAIGFDGGRPDPYTLKGSASADEVDAATLLPAAGRDADPVIEGHFAVTRSLDGRGATLSDLLARTREMVRLSSSGGIIRLFKTDVADTLPQVATPAADALGTVGSAVGSIFGIKRGSWESNRNPLSPNAEAVIDFTNHVAEIGYDALTATAVREPGGPYRITSLDLVAPDEHVTGTGEVGWIEGRPFAAQPIRLELRFATHGRLADLLVKGGLRLEPAAGQGFRTLSDPVPFTGLAGHIDGRAWHDLLARAADRPAEKKK